MFSRESEPKSTYIEGGNPEAIKNYLQGSVRSAQTGILAAEFSLKTTHRFNIIRRRRLNNQVTQAQREIKRLIPVLIKHELKEATDAANSQLS